MKQALAEQGIVGEGRSMTERAVWVQKEKEALAELKNTITDLKEKLAAVTQELAGYKSIRNQLYVSELEQENDYLRGKLEKYNDVIKKNDLRRYFRKPAEKDRGR